MNLSLVLFLIGILGFILNRKNIILMIIAIEIMLLAVTLLILISSFSFDDNIGQTFSIYIIAIAADRTREELIPFLQESVDDEDEVLLALAEELGKGFEEYVGGKKFAHVILGPLEPLSAAEETLVRDKVSVLIVHRGIIAHDYSLSFPLP